MSLKVDYRVVGDKKVLAKIKEFQKKSPEKLVAGLDKLGAFISGEAKKSTPVDTGRLRSSLIWVVSTKGGKDEYYQGSLVTKFAEPEGGKDKPILRVGTGVEYAPHIEFGTSKMPGRPYLLPALYRGKQKLEPILKKEFKDL